MDRYREGSEGFLEDSNQEGADGLPSGGRPGKSPVSS